MRPFAIATWFLALAPAPLLACSCQLSLDVCSATSYSNVIFVGTVESVAPDVMTRWKPPSREPIARVNGALEQYLHDRSPAKFTRLKDAVRAAFPGIAPEDEHRLESATGPRELASLLASVLEGNRQVRFRVRTLFRKTDDDDKPDSDGKQEDDDDEVPAFLEVLTPFGDCGTDFQVGETYLVYAYSDEETNELSTDACSRTRRASDAGADLAYLSFYKDKKNPAGRVQGFATYDVQYQVHAHPPERIALPAEGTIVELKSEHGVRYTPANQFGQFVFDGLEAGSYGLTAYAAGFPDTRKVLSGPRSFRLEPRACTTQILLLLKDATP